MKKKLRRWFTWPRVVLYCVAALGLAAWWVPKISADRYRDPLHADELGRSRHFVAGLQT